MGERLSKIDEHLLLGQGSEARKEMLKQLRGIRTRTTRTLQILDAAEKRGPNEGADERERLRRDCSQALAGVEALLDKLEAELQDS